MPEPRWSWCELWGKLFCADVGIARRCPKADVRDIGPSGYGSQKRTCKSRRADFGGVMSAFGQRRLERVRFQARVAYRVRRPQNDHGPARPRHPPLRYRRDRQRQLALQKPQITPGPAASKSILRCARLRSGYARPPPHAAQGHLQQTNIISEKGSLFDADRGSLLNAV